MTRELEELRRRIAGDIMLSVISRQTVPSAAIFVEGFGPQTVVDFSVLLATSFVQRLESTQLWGLAPNPFASSGEDPK